MLTGISTPYRRLGLLHQKHRDHFGVDDDNVLVVQGTSTMDDHANAACGALHMIGRAPVGLEAISIDAWVRILHDVSVAWPTSLRA
jgi:hypothetical protein